MSKPRMQRGSHGFFIVAIKETVNISQTHSQRVCSKRANGIFPRIYGKMNGRMGAINSLPFLPLNASEGQPTQTDMPQTQALNGFSPILLFIFVTAAIIIGIIAGLLFFREKNSMKEINE